METISFSSAPIGIFDSGLGGLSVLREVQRQLPHESILYLADTANVPYGDKPISVVADLALRLTRTLIERGCKLIIMASGTSTVAGLEQAQAQYPTMPILGTIEVGARAALTATAGSIGVLATNATVQSRAFTLAVQSRAPERPVIEQGCPRFVPLVESGQGETPEALEAAREYLEPMEQAEVGAIILGCTHFPFLLPALHKTLAQSSAHPFQTIFVDPAAEVVAETISLLASHRLLAPASLTPTLHFSATGDPAEFTYFASRLLGEPLPPADTLSL